MKSLKFIIPVCLLAVLFSCKKSSETSVIEGSVKKIIYDMDLNNVQDTVFAADENICLVKVVNGNTDNAFLYNDKDEKTSYKGDYRFDNVASGDYMIVVYSDDTIVNELGKKVPVKIEGIHVSGGTKTIAPITIVKRLKVDDGFATIEGTVLQKNWTKNFVKKVDTTYAQEVDVYLVYENHTSFDIRTRTAYDGTFRITNLIKGDYKAYVMSKDTMGRAEDFPIFMPFSVTETNQAIKLPTVYINDEL
jgi:hypothetical protein